MSDHEMTKFLDGVIGVVEANSYEKHMLWVENDRRANPKTWTDYNCGLVEVIGFVVDMPICISLFPAEVGGHKLLFIDATSQVVDYRMIDQWLKDNPPASAFREDSYVNKTNAMNFHNVFPR